MWWEDLTRGWSEHIFHFLNCANHGAGGSGGRVRFCLGHGWKPCSYLREGDTGAPDGEIPNHSGSQGVGCAVRFCLGHSWKPCS